MSRLRVGATTAVALLTACSAAPRVTLEPRTVSVFTDPPGAEVYRLGPLSDEKLLLGTSPVVEQTVDVLTRYRGRLISEDAFERMSARVGKVHLVIEKPGYRTHQQVLSLAADESKQYRAELEPDRSP